MKSPLLTLISLTCFFTGCAQGGSQQKPAASDKKVGGSCEGCEAIYESPVPFDQLKWVDTLPGFFDEGEKFVVYGTIYQSDGKTPAPVVVLYIYHTDQKGIYPKKGDEKGWAQRHGYMRGWIKTDNNGAYKFYTSRPASYPNSRNPQHIHPTIKEPGYSEYYIDEFIFADDPVLDKEEGNHAENRGGNGLLHPKLVNGIYEAKRDIILGKNIPGHPGKNGK